MFMSGGGSLSISSALFINNTALGHGGAAHVGQDVVCKLKKSLFAQNTAGEYGGALSTWRTNSIRIEGGCDFANNTASWAGAALIYNDEGAGVLIEDAKFRNNMASGSAKTNMFQLNDNDNIGAGGALYLQLAYQSAKPVFLSKTQFSDNNATWGGGLYINTEGCGRKSFTVCGVFASGLRLQENSAKSAGGGVFLDNVRRFRVKCGTPITGDFTPGDPTLVRVETSAMFCKQQWVNNTVGAGGYGAVIATPAYRLGVREPYDKSPVVTPLSHALVQVRGVQHYLM
jgi:predicted outer membrane repeat protein